MNEEPTTRSTSQRRGCVRLASGRLLAGALLTSTAAVLTAGSAAAAEPLGQVLAAGSGLTAPRPTTILALVIGVVLGGLLIARIRHQKSQPTDVDGEDYDDRDDYPGDDYDQ